MTTATVPSLREITPEGHLILHLHPGQMRAWKCTARFTVVLAGTQGGKTSFVPHWVHKKLTEILLKKQQQPTWTPSLDTLGDGLIGSATYDQFMLKMLPEIRLVFEDILKIGRYWAVSRVLELSENLQPVYIDKNGVQHGRFRAQNASDPMFGRLILRSADAAAGWEAATCILAVLDEGGSPEYTVGIWEATLRRLSLSQGPVLITTTLYNIGWLKAEVYDRWVAGDKDYEVIQFDSTDNPNFSQEEFERAKRSMPAWKFNMFYRGRYDKPAGLVYNCFDTQTMVIDGFPIPPSWLWYTGHDFGGSNPAALALAQDPATGLLYLVHEYLPGPKSVSDQVQNLKEFLKGRYVLRRVGGSHQEVGWRDDYTAQGWPIIEPEVHDVAQGIARAYALIKRGAFFVFRDNKQFLNEIATYSYKLGDGYTVLDDIQDKSSYHLLDCLRYVASSFPYEIAGNRYDKPIPFPRRW